MSLTAPEHPVAAETVQSRVYGTFFFTGFGTVWLLTGIANLHHFTPAAASAIVAVGVCTLGAGFALLRMASRLPSRVQTPAEIAREKRVFNAVNIIQWVAIATAVVVLILLRIPEYIVPTIGIIVGLHLYPLAGAFHNPLHYVTGTVLVSWCTACIALLPRQQITGTGAFGTGAVLLASAIVTLLLAYRGARGVLGHPGAVRHA